MKIVSKYIEKDGSGHVKLVPEDLEDMWHIYNLVNVNDKVHASTIRRVQSESTTGSVDSSRLRINLTIGVETIEPDMTVGVLHLNGKVVEENKHVKIGAYHTMALEINHPFKLIKECWDVISLERLDHVSKVQNKAEVAAVVLQEGLANICLMTENMTVVAQKVEVTIPRKRKGSSSQHDKAIQRFLEQIYQAMLKNFKFDILKGIIIASPGFLKEQLYEFVFKEALNRGDKNIFEAKSKFLCLHCSSGHKLSLKEILEDPVAQSQLADTKYAQEVKELNLFYSLLNDDPDRAYYGYDHVKKAADQGAVKVMMVSDELFRSADVATRKKYIALVENVRQQGAKVFIFSSSHVTGEQLSQLAGVAATLLFGLPDIEE